MRTEQERWVDVYLRSPSPPGRRGNFVALVLNFLKRGLQSITLFAHSRLQHFLELLHELLVGGGGFGVG